MCSSVDLKDYNDIDFSGNTHIVITVDIFLSPYFYFECHTGIFLIINKFKNKKF